MINVSNEFKLLMNERTNFKQNAEVTFADGTMLSLSEADFSVSNNSVSDAADANSIPLGVAISRSIQIELMNDDDHLLEYDFFGAKIRLFLTYQLSETVEKIEYGTFTVVAPETYGSTVIISANDDMYRADKAYSTSLAFPATIKNMLIDSCDACDIPFVSASFPNDDFVVTQKPSSEYTHRQIIGYIAMIAGGNARVNRQGYLEILPYSFDFTQEHHSLTNWKSLKVDTDDITITGIQTTYEKEVSVTDDEGNETTESQKVTILEGDEGYVLSISNPLIAGQEQTVLSLIGETLIGRTFRKFEGDHIAYPLAEFMDLAEIKDRKGNVYRSFLTDVNFVFFGFTTMKNSAESGVRNGSRYFSNPTAALIEARKLIEKEKTARETAVENLAKTLANSSGLYTTAKKQDDGSTIYYLHDKPTLAESATVMKLTAEAIGVSTDGGKTYPYGFTVTGEMITRVLQTGGINADWINSGTILVKASDGTVVFSADITTGKVVINADSISIGGKAVATQEYAKALAEKATNLTVLLSNEYQSIPTDSSGNYTTFPECSTAIQVLYGQTDITSQCTLSATTSAGVTGSLSGTTYTVTALAADTGWVDIKATYLGTLTAVKRFTVSKVKNGAQGSNIRILNTEISMVQEEIDTNSAKGYSRNWTVITSTDGLKAGDSVMIQVYNDTKGGEAYILATVNEILSEYRINATSAGLLDKGEDGNDGASGRVYILEPSVTMIKRGQDSVPIPDEITFSAYYRDGSSASRTAYSGRFIIERSTDGNSWETVYTSSVNETSCRYELYTAIEDGNGNYLEDGSGNVIVAWYDEDAVMFRCTLYAAGGTASALDMQTVPVVIDVAALTHMQIFNLLTNNGAWQGLFYENGHLYMNGQYMRFVGANIGGWDINETSLYKDVVASDGTIYRVFLQPTSEQYPDGTWILSCQKSTDGGATFTGSFVLYSNGMAKFGNTIIHPSGKIYAIANGHIVKMQPADDENTDVFSTGDYDADTNGYTNTAYIQANGAFHTRKVIVDSAPTYPHIVGDSHYLQMSHDDNNAHGVVIENGMFRPPVSGGCNLGSDVYLWGQIYSVNTAISLSDEREKNTITPLDGDLWKEFLLGLDIVSYKFNGGTSDRLHHGMISQRVEQLLAKMGINTKDFAGFVKWQKTIPEEREETFINARGQKAKRKYYEEVPVYDEDGNPVYGYALRYEEFLPMTIKAVQGLYAENQELKEEMATMKKDIEELKQMMKEVG